MFIRDNVQSDTVAAQGFGSLGLMATFKRWPTNFEWISHVIKKWTAQRFEGKKLLSSRKVLSMNEAVNGKLFLLQ